MSLELCSAYLAEATTVLWNFFYFSGCDKYMRDVHSHTNMHLNSCIDSDIGKELGKSKSTHVTSEGLRTIIGADFSRRSPVPWQKGTETHRKGLYQKHECYLRTRKIIQGTSVTLPTIVFITNTKQNTFQSVESVINVYHSTFLQ